MNLISWTCTNIIRSPGPRLMMARLGKSIVTKWSISLIHKWKNVIWQFCLADPDTVLASPCSLCHCWKYDNKLLISSFPPAEFQPNRPPTFCSSCSYRMYWMHFFFSILFGFITMMLWNRPLMISSLKIGKSLEPILLVVQWGHKFNF